MSAHLFERQSGTECCGICGELLSSHPLDMGPPPSPPRTTPMDERRDGKSRLVYDKERRTIMNEGPGQPALNAPAAAVGDWKWLIWSNEHRLWWRASAAGYTSNVDEAGRYTFAIALSYCNKRDRQDDGTPSEMPVPAPESYAALAAVPAVPVQGVTERIACPTCGWYCDPSESVCPGCSKALRLPMVERRTGPKTRRVKQESFESVVERRDREGDGCTLWLYGPYAADRRTAKPEGSEQ